MLGLLWKRGPRKAGIQVRREKLPEEAEAKEDPNGPGSFKSLKTLCKKSRHPFPDSVPTGQNDNVTNMS